MLEAGKLAILAKEKFAKVQELYKVSLIQTYSFKCWDLLLFSISGIGHSVASWKLLEVLPAVGLHHLMGLLPCLPYSLP